MSPITSGGKAVSGVVGALKAQPLVLALIVINLIYIAIGGLIWRETNTRRAQLIDRLLTSCIQEKPIP